MNIGGENVVDMKLILSAGGQDRVNLDTEFLADSHLFRF